MTTVDENVVIETNLIQDRTADPQEERNLDAQQAEFGEVLGKVIARIQTKLHLTQSDMSQLIGLSQPTISQLSRGRRGVPSNPHAVRAIKRLDELASQATETPESDREIGEVLNQLTSEAATFSRGGTRPRRSRLEVKPYGMNGTADAADPGAIAKYVYRSLTYLASPKELEALAQMAQTAAPGLAPVLEKAAAASARQFVEQFGQDKRLVDL
ncbi:MAG: XRE family transcriptional regulator [Actinobacteria bacterium]|nr:XRE family transcriptional regulator [Actinomycetota bacterium]MCB9389020.1 XRE family transcriptional regulator [Acidimicrobiia bacterium]